MTKPTYPEPMVSVAGVRGVVGESLRPENFLAYAQGFLAGVDPPRIVLGGDTRPSGDLVRHIVFAAAIAAGVEVLDLGVVPTPTVGLMTRRLGAGGGIAITASHNPTQWNALKFFSDRGSFLRPEQLNAVLDRVGREDFRRASVASLGRVVPVADPLGPHLDAVLAALPVEAIRNRGFRVALDACNGAGLEIATRLLAALGASVRTIHADPALAFERPPEPLPHHLSALSEAVRESGADIGFALDPDADRLAIVDETGRPIGEERTVTLAIDYVLRTEPGPAVVNLSTSRAVEGAAARRGAEVLRTAIGEAHVVARMEESGARIGGEGNGGVIFPRVHPGRDAASGIGLVLALMAADPAGRPLSALNAEIPDYAMVKDKIDLPDRALVAPALARLKAEAAALARAVGAPAPALDETDGLKLVFPDRWLHVRASGTEPIVRLFAEAPEPAQAEALVARARELASAG